MSEGWRWFSSRLARRAHRLWMYEQLAIGRQHGLLHVPAYRQLVAEYHTLLEAEARRSRRISSVLLNLQLGTATAQVGLGVWLAVSAVPLHWVVGDLSIACGLWGMGLAWREVRRLAREAWTRRETKVLEVFSR